jgi:transcriptional regulator with XRE-family HTH domain
MSTSFAENLRLALNLLSISGAKLASEMEVDKSVVSRWLSGGVQPSAHNLSRLSALMATRVEGFRTLDWQRDPASLAALFGADLDTLPGWRQPTPTRALPLAVFDQLLAASAVRGPSYEGFYRSTRPHPMVPGKFLQEHGIVRRDATGLMRLRLGTAGSVAEGWLMPLHGLVYVIAADVTSGTLVFGIFNGVGSAKVEVFDGIALIPGSDMGRSPTATGMICERISDLSNDPEADDRRLAELTQLSPVVPDGAVPEALQKHLVRDIGPAAHALGGEWLLNVTLNRTLSRGAFDPLPNS